MNSDVTVEQYSLVSVSRELGRHWKGFLVSGIILLLLGLAAIAFPVVTTVATTLVIGAVLAMAGVIELIHAFGARRWGGFMLYFLGGILGAGIGVLLLLFPLEGMLSLTLLLAAFFLAGGLFRTLLAFQIRPYDSWGWLLFSGILGLVLGGLILYLWPAGSAWILGLMVGVDLFFTGWWLTAAALASRRAVRP